MQAAARAFAVWSCAAVCTLGMAPRAGAANLQISPVSITVRAEQSAAGIALQNLGQQAIFGQVRVYQWDQHNGQDVLTPTDQVVASPPIVQIGAEASQTIRLVRTGAPGPVERTYRVLIDEIARPGAGPATGVDIRLRYSVPVFVLPAGAPGSVALDWKVLRRDRQWLLALTNRGQVHAQVGALKLRNAAGAEFVVSKGLYGYVLAGREREWRLPVPEDAALDGKLSIDTVINAKPVSVDTRGVRE